MSMDDASWMMLATAVLLVGVAIVMWRLRARSQAARAAAAGPLKPRDKRRSPRRVNSRRETFRIGKDDNDRRSGDDRRRRKPGWHDDPGKRR